jgi:phospholipid/cholesterol/gamma-HCH transport system ATP-binding protein
MPAVQPILALLEAEPRMLGGTVGQVPLSLEVTPGDFAMVQCDDPERIASFADICCGVWPLRRGSVRFLGRDWTLQPEAYAAALRGRIGRMFAGGGWIDFMDAETNILLPHLHHTRDDRAGLQATAAELARDFGLPGLPSGPISGLSAGDLAGAACIRAFLGEPLLIILESPLRSHETELTIPLLTSIARARDRRTAVLWLTQGDAVWSDRLTPATSRHRLTERGLAPLRRFA